VTGYWSDAGQPDSLGTRFLPHIQPRPSLSGAGLLPGRGVNFLNFGTVRRLERTEVQRLEFRIGHYLRGMEEILKSFRGPLTVKYWTNTAHEEPYNNSNGQASASSHMYLAYGCVQNGPLARRSEPDWR
jgi:hypothetical protein